MHILQQNVCQWPQFITADCQDNGCCKYTENCELKVKCVVFVAKYGINYRLISMTQFCRCRETDSVVSGHSVTIGSLIQLFLMPLFTCLSRLEQCNQIQTKEKTQKTNAKKYLEICTCSMPSESHNCSQVWNLFVVVVVLTTKTAYYAFKGILDVNLYYCNGLT